MSYYNCIKRINSRIQKEICKKTIFKLNDNYLLNEYKQTKSVQSKITNIHNVLTKFNIPKINKINITNELINYIIPAGTKGVIKGNKFNKIVQHHILNLKLDSNRYDIQFETKLTKINNINEIPDWYIYDKISKKYLIGMNQLDLWNGGHQLNRGFKYIQYNTDTGNGNTKLNHKILCVICNEISLKTTNNKIYTLFNKGFSDNSICYLKNLEHLILDYFNP
jgi:hypothetical protein